MDVMNLRRLDLNLLLALDRLLAHEAVTPAARELGLSQPAMSRSLARLREAVGDPLLVPQGRGLVATERGRALRPLVTEALASVERVFAPEPIFDPATARGVFVVAAGDELQVEGGAAVALALRAAAPGVDLRLARLTAETLDESRRGAVDLAIAPDLRSLPGAGGSPDLGQLVVRPVYERRFVVVGRRGTRAPDLDAFCAADHVIVSFEGGGRGFVDDLLEGLGRRRRVAVSVTSFHAAVALAARSALLATVPSDVVWAKGDVDAFPPPLDVPTVPVGLMWHPRHTAAPRHRFLREVVAGAVRDFAGTIAP